MAKTGRTKRQRDSLPKLIEKYYADLADLARQNVFVEMGTRTAFFALLHAAGREHGWTLIAEQEKKVGGKTIRPDGTFKDEMYLVRGYWEAKDTADKLDVEIEKKRKAGYPLKNIIFEDTATAVLYQHGQRILTADMRDPVKLAELITEFFRYVEPEIEEFEQAVAEFKERVPDLAEGLEKKIEQAHRTNPAFKKAFADFFELCQTSLNPNIAQAAVDEMLIQHILTERLIREIFDNPEFVRRNVIAAEVEKVMQAMTSQSFDRNTYLRELDRFYVAIEHAARTMTDWSDKQYFLNTVYERFFQGYSVKLADTMGIVYTPPEIVKFMCASVEEVLDKEFGKKLWSDDVYIIDPCTGTGNFVVNLIKRHIPKAKLEDVYKHRLFANEIMLLPYYIAALNIEHAYWEQTGKYEGFEGLCFVDTLDLTDHPQGELEFMTAANSERVERQRRSPITVIIGNPPYNARQQNENDNNKNRKYPTLEKRIRETFVKDSDATNKNALDDPYIKFFRWAADRLQGREGIVCFISNNAFLHKHAYDGIRKHLLRDFTEIYHIDLHGDRRRGLELTGTSHNVFGIPIGVGITVAIRRKSAACVLRINQVPETWKKEQKLAWLVQQRVLSSVAWEQVTPDQRGDWLIPENSDQFAGFIPVGVKVRGKKATVVNAIFARHTAGVVTSRDNWAYDFSQTGLAVKIERHIESYNAEVDRWKRRKGPDVNVDQWVLYDDAKLKWSRDLKLDLKDARHAEFKEEKLRHSLYRPFTPMWIFYDDIMNEETRAFGRFIPNLQSENENALVCVSGPGHDEFRCLAANRIIDYKYSNPANGGSQSFPFYLYDEDGTNRRENITDWALKQFREHYKDKKIGKWDIFHYVYGLLHHPGYRQKYADNLKRELPRIPFAPAHSPSPGTPGEGRGEGFSGFWAFAKAGEKLAKLHLDYEKLKPWDLDFIETPGMPLSYRIEDKMRLSKDKLRLTVNPSLTLTTIPPQAFNYRLGNRSALEWVIDQYQVSTDKRSGITSDPNREDDPRYIVRLVGQVIRVSIETVKVVNELPAEFEPAK